MYETGRVPREGVLGIWDRLVNLSEQIPMWLILLTTRIGVAMIFLKSGMTKTTTGLNVADGTFTLFEYEYALPVIPPDIGKSDPENNTAGPVSRPGRINQA